MFYNFTVFKKYAKEEFDSFTRVKKKEEKHVHRGEGVKFSSDAPVRVSNTKVECLSFVRCE